LVTHLFQAGDKFIETDVVYGVKEPLIVDFKTMPAGAKAPDGRTMDEPFYVVHYDFVLQPAAQAAIAAE
jgi:hydroxyquinol 1,2-dioxygenase